MNENSDHTPGYAGLIRRLLAIIYDLFLLIAVLFIATTVAMVFNKGQAIEPGQFMYPLYVAYLLIVSFGFYGWFWTHGGQTLGMKTWKIKLQRANGDPVDWAHAAIRFVAAMISWLAAGLGFIWSLFDAHNRCWHDLASDSVVIDLRPDK